MTIIDQVLDRLDGLTKQMYDNKIEILRAIQDCPRGLKHDDQIEELKTWKDQLTGKIAVIVLLCSMGGAGLVFSLMDFIKWKLGAGVP